MDRRQIMDEISPIFKDVMHQKNIVLNEIVAPQDVDTWDSVTNLLFISELEKHFGIRFKLKETVKLNNIGDFVSLIQSKL